MGFCGGVAGALARGSCFCCGGRGWLEVIVVCLVDVWVRGCGGAARRVWVRRVCGERLCVMSEWASGGGWSALVLVVLSRATAGTLPCYLVAAMVCRGVAIAVARRSPGALSWGRAVCPAACGS